MINLPKLSIPQVLGLLWLLIVWIVCLYFVTTAESFTPERFQEFSFLVSIFSAPVFFLFLVFINKSRCNSGGGVLAVLTLGVITFFVAGSAHEDLKNLSNGWLFFFVLVVLWLGGGLSLVVSAISPNKSVKRDAP